MGERKVLDLKAAGARVTVVSPSLTPTLAQLAAQGEIHYLKEDFSPEHLDGMVLVFGATDDPEVNSRLSAAAKARNLWVNIADAPELCTFIVPAQVRRGDLTLAISTGGASPALARQLRMELENQLGPEYGPYLSLLREARLRILRERRGHPENAALFQATGGQPLAGGPGPKGPGAGQAPDSGNFRAFFEPRSPGGVGGAGLSRRPGERLI